MGQPSTSNQIRLQLDDASIILPLTKTASKGRVFVTGERAKEVAPLLHGRLQSWNKCCLNWPKGGTLCQGFAPSPHFQA